MKKRILALFLVTVMIMGALASCGNFIQDNDADREPITEEYTTVKGKDDSEDGALEGWDGKTKLDYTYRVGREKLGSNFNPHLTMTDADREIFQYISSPLVDVSIKTTGNGGVYQWVYEMATAVTDVTEQYKNDLVKYGVTKSASDISDGYVYEIKLNPDAKWENGEKITAKDYVSSMALMLNSKMKNSGAKPYYEGDAAIAGAYEYFNSGNPKYVPVVPPYGSNSAPDYSFDLESNDVYISFTRSDVTLTGYSFESIKNDHGFIKDLGAEYYDELDATKNEYGYIKVTDENREKVLYVMDQYLSIFGASIYTADGEVNDEYFKELSFRIDGNYADVEFDRVGIYEVDEYTIRYVCENHTELGEFLMSLRFNWLVYEPLYTELMDESATCVTTTYGTSIESTMSYGVYKLIEYVAGEKAILTQNENWYGFEKNSDGTPKRDKEGNLISYSNFEVDGAKARQYVTTKIQIDVMSYDAIKNAFLKGELSEFTPNSDELSWYVMSDRLMKIDEEYTLSLFMNNRLDVLQFLDSRGENTNSVVLSNDNFRRALSLSLNRAELANSAYGYKPATGFINSLYHYDLYNNPESSYRASDEAMQATVELYGVEYGEGQNYKTLEEAYWSITGYDSSKATSLMKTACEELAYAGLYTEGEDISIKIAWAKGELTDKDRDLVALINQYVNEAVRGSGFGKITFEAVGNLNNRYSAVFCGDYAMGYGAWGGDVNKPFAEMNVYCDAINSSIAPYGYDTFWNPATNDLTIRVGGKDVTMTWLDWSRACTTGKYANADNETKLYITATMEAEFLKLGLFVPLFYSTECFLTSYQFDYCTVDYNVMYGFGGLRLMKYNYDDAAFQEFLMGETVCPDY